jgi:hypothetical protein
VRRSWLARSLDGLTHFAVLALAAWTLVYDAGLAAHLDTTLLLAVWALCVVAIIAGLAFFPAATVVYEISLPVFTFLAIWAVWMLIRRWAPRRYAFCFALAMVYLAWTGGGASFGAFHLGTMWEGKAAFVSLMVPLLYFYLTDWAENRTGRGLVLVIASGVAAAGLSSAAVYIVPLITVAVAAGLLLGRMVKEALGAALSSVYPLAAGLLVTLLAPVAHVPHVTFTAPTVWSWVLKGGAVGAVGGVALWTAPWLARRGVPALITVGIGGLAAIVMLPGAVGLLGDSLGISPVIWRVLWVVPGPVLVGLLPAVPLPFANRFRAAGRVLAPVPAGALAAVLAVSGVPVWSHLNGVTMATHPSWKVDAASLRLAQGITRADRSRGDILAPWQVMETIPLLTTTTRAVNPRGLYLLSLDAGPRFVGDRQLLTTLADGDYPLPGVATVRAAVARTGVGYACVWRYEAGVIRRLEKAGFTRAARIGALQCLRR